MNSNKHRKIITFSKIQLSNALDNVYSFFPNIRKLSEDQFTILHSLINGNDTIISLPTGSGKSIPSFILPVVLNILDPSIKKPICLYLSPLVALNLSIANMLTHFGISHMIMDENFTEINNENILIGTPERVLTPKITKILHDTNLKCIVVDEAHLSVLWGLDVKKKSSAFRPMLSRIGELGIFKAPFAVMSATLSKKSIRVIKKNLLYIKDWVEISKPPDRKNLRYFIHLAKNGEIQEILHIVKKYLDAKEEESMLINVNLIMVGFECYISVYHIMKEKGLLLVYESLPNQSSNRTLAFIHSGVSDERKKQVVDDLCCKNPKIKVVIGTAALGTGVDMKIGLVLSLGLPMEDCSFLQLAGRAGRSGIKECYDTVFLHSSKFSRIPKDSEIRDLIEENPQCIRKISNQWFSSDKIVENEPHNCCSICMERCFNEHGCSKCSYLLNKYKPKEFVPEKNDIDEIIYELSKQCKREKIKIGKRKPKFIEIRNFVNSLIDLSPNIMTERDIMDTFNVTEELGNISFEWILKIRSKYNVLDYEKSSICFDDEDFNSEDESDGGGCSSSSEYSD